MSGHNESIKQLSRAISCMKRDVSEFLELYYRHVGSYYHGGEAPAESRRGTLHDSYRHLAKRWHPDACAEQSDKAYYGEMFKRVSEAYARKDAVTLHALEQMNGCDDVAGALVQTLQKEADALKASPEYALAQRHFEAGLRGVNLITEIASTMRRKYSYQSHQHSLGLKPMAAH